MDKCKTCGAVYTPSLDHNLFICGECTASRPILNDNQLKILEDFIKEERGE